MTRDILRPYALAILATAAALAVSLLFRSTFQPVPFMLFFGAVGAAAWYGGFGPAVLATCLSAFAATYYLIPPSESLAVGASGARTVALFVLVSLFLSVLSEARRRAEASARRSERWLGATLSSIGDAVIATDPKGCVTFMNPVAAHLTGWPESEAVRRPLHEVFHVVSAGSRQRVPDPVETVLRKGGGVDLPNRTVLVARDGREVPIDDSGAPILTTEGKLLGVILVFRDVSERERAAEALHTSRERYRAVAETASDAIVIIDEESRIEYANPATERMFGYASQEMLGESLTLLMPETLRAAHRSGIRRYLTTGERRIPWTGVELPGQTRDGREIPLEISFGEFLKGGRRFFSGIMRDVSERKAAQAEQARLALSEEKARALVETSLQHTEFLAEASVALAASLDYGVTLQNVARLAVPQVADWCIIDVLEANGTSRRIAIANPDPARVELAWELERRYPSTNDLDVAYGPPHVLRTGRPELVTEITDEMLQALCRDGEQLEAVRRLGFRSYVCVALEARGRRLGAITLATAESGRRYGASDLAFAEDLAGRAALALDNARLYREAQEANRLKDEFLATLSHELRTPLQAILGWARLLRSPKLDGAMFARAVDTIHRSGRAQAQIVDDILDVSRIITGKLRLELQAVDLVPVVEAAVDSIRPAAEAKAIQVRKIMDPLIGAVSGDPARLQQVVWNLLSNAVKFTPKGGRVEIRLERVDSHVQVAVSDTGSGFPPEFQPHLFERFRQADSSSTREHGGLGLGLAIVRHLVELHGGTVGADCAGQGSGATFTVTLPLRVLRDREIGLPRLSRGESDQAAEPPSLQGLRLLLVDDDPDAREMLETVLRGAGAEVIGAASTGEAIERLEHERPDLLISDIGMPGEDGYALIRRVRARPAGEGGDIPALALTAYARSEDRVQALSSGFQAHVAKPVDPFELAWTVARLAPGSRPQATV